MNPGVENQRWKILNLQETIATESLHTPFFILTETHLKSCHLDAEVHIKNFSCFRADRTDRKGGGASIYLHNSIIADCTKSFSNSYCDTLMIYVKSMNLVLVGVYRPPLAPFDKFSDCLDVIQDFIDGIEETSPELYIAGDFNFPFINWTSVGIDPGKSILLSDRQSALALINFAEENFLIQMVSETTRNDKSVLDLIFSNNSDMIHSISISKTEQSDHDIVHCTLLHPGFLPTSQPGRPPYSPTCLPDDINFNSANWSAINSELQQLDWSELSDPALDQDQSWKIFEDTVANICSKHAPSHARNRQAASVSNIPKHRRVLLQKKKRLNSKINTIKYGENNRRSDVKLIHLNEQRATVELLMRDDLKNDRIRKETDAISKIKVNPKAFYSFAKKSADYKPPVGPLLDENNQLQSDPTTMANILQKQYQTAFSDPSKVDPTNITLDREPMVLLDDIIFTVADVHEAIDKLQTSSAPGPDKFPAIILKECKEALAPQILKIWQASFESGTIADSFKTQSITPIFKKGSKAIAANYRPVSLTSHLIKVFERVIRCKMVNFIEGNNLLNPNQHGFRSGRSCLTQLLHHIDDIINDLCNDSNADVIYLDFSKAFDKVDHNILLRKLWAYGIRGRLYRWIEAFLRDRKQFVIVEGWKSFLAAVISGVPQGTVLGPLLFLLYIDDITTVVLHSKIKIFADDSKIHKLIRSLLDRLLLQEDLERVVDWAESNNMELNEEKFQLLQHGKNNDLKLPYTLPSGQVLYSAPYVKDLGVYVDSDLKWRTHIAMKSQKAKNMASWVLRTFTTRDTETMMLLYKSYVRSHLEYCGPLWSPHLKCDIIQIEAVQRSFTAKISGFRALNYWERLRRLSLYSLQRRRERYTIILTWKIYNDILPNSVNIVFRESSRHGTSCTRPLGDSKYSSINTLRFNSFASTASALYNVVPPHIKSLNTLTKFKSALDAFLKSFPDTPPTPGYIGQNSNSMLEWAGSICN